MHWPHYLNDLRDKRLCRSVGRVSRVSSMMVEASGLCNAYVGELCSIEGSGGNGNRCLAEVVGLRDRAAMLMPFGDTRGIALSDSVLGTGESLRVPINDSMLGSVIDPFGRPIGGESAGIRRDLVQVRGQPRNPMSRRQISENFDTGVRAIDSFLTIGKGQRAGIFAGSGVGKSTLLGMIARHSSSDINVIALIGERGREVGEFVSKILGPDGLAKSVVVVATSDQPALVRELAAHTALAVAEHFCGRGEDVLLIMDSVTRFAMAHREIGLSAGEPATARGYTPSAFAAMPKLLERAGAFAGSGTITGIFTVLVEGDDLHEPVSDHMRAILDGHIVLSRDMANHGIFPAIDLMQSVSRLASELRSERDNDLVRHLLKAVSTHERHRDMIEVGAYRRGSNPEVDRATDICHELREMLTQRFDDRADRQGTFDALHRLASKAVAS